MEFFKHSSTAQYSKDLKRIEQAYGVAGIGFYWKAVEILFLSQMPTPIINILKDGYKRLSRTEAERIILESGIFDVDELNRVTLKKEIKDVDYGIDKKSLETYFSKLTLCSGGISRTGSRVEACAEACTEACTETGTGTVPLKTDKDKSREDNIAREALLIFMEERCPHLLEMAEPLTLKQFRELKKSYSWEQIKEVLLDMENDVGLNKRKRNCYQTTLSWLKKRFGPPQGSNKKNNGAIFCGLDENGSPIYNLLKNDKNGKQDSNSAVRPADAEQQGDGGGCVERPDE